MATHFCVYCKKNKDRETLGLYATRFPIFSKRTNPVLATLGGADHNNLIRRLYMANESVAASSRHRNSILGIASTNHGNLFKNSSFTQAFYFFNSKELGTVLGLAWTAIMTEGSDIAIGQAEMNIFLKYRDFVQHEAMLDIVTVSIVQLLESGFAAFKALHFPSFYHDFICRYHGLLNSYDLVPLNIKQAMKDILNLNAENGGIV
jgi:hypothetical protein